MKRVPLAPQDPGAGVQGQPPLPVPKKSSAGSEGRVHGAGRKAEGKMPRGSLT